MRKAMANAAVGDDVYGEDPTVNRLQEQLAAMAGFEAGLFLPSGSMSNQVALAAHTKRGQEVIAPEGAHIYEFELGALAALSGLIPRLVSAPLGVPKIEDIRTSIHRGTHQAPTGLIVLENTHNLAGGTVIPIEDCLQIARLAKQEGLPIHLDGARAFNAAIAQGISIATLCAPFDSVSLCLSKGLAAPIGTVLLGPKDFIDNAHRYRKMFGGGMRQAGVIAAAGIVALDTMTDRLAEDHARARVLAEGLMALGGVQVNLEAVQTNMVYCHCADAPRLAERMADQGVLCNALGSSMLRMVTHYQISDENVETTLRVVAEVLRS